MSCASKRCQVRSCACTRAPTSAVPATHAHRAHVARQLSFHVRVARALTHAHAHTRIARARTHTYTHANTHARTHTRVHAHARTHTHARTRAHTVFYNVRDGPYYPTLRIAHQYPFCMPTMRVDSGAIKFVLSGYVLVRTHSV